MRYTALVVGAVAALAGLTLTAAPLAKTSKSKKLKCTTSLTLQPASGQTAPNPGNSSGQLFGTVSCQGPLGKGVQSQSYTRTSKTATTGSTTATYKQFFDKGTLHGTSTVDYTVTSTAVTFTGNAKITGGTGAYKGAKGTAKINCTSSDGGIHTSCTGQVTYTHL